MTMRRLLGRVPVGLLIALVTAGAAAVILTSNSVIRAQPEGEGGSMDGSGMPGMGGGPMGMPGEGGGGEGAPQVEAEPTGAPTALEQESMVSFPNIPGVSGLSDTGTFYRFTYSESTPAGDRQIRVEIPRQLQGIELTNIRHYPEMWGQIFEIFEAGSAQREGELPEEREARLAGAKAGSKWMISRSGDEESVTREPFEGTLPEEQDAIQQGLQAGSAVAAERIRSRQ